MLDSIRRRVWSRLPNICLPILISCRSRKFPPNRLRQNHLRLRQPLPLPCQRPIATQNQPQNPLSGSPSGDKTCRGKTSCNSSCSPAKSDAKATPPVPVKSPVAPSAKPASAVKPSTPSAPPKPNPASAPAPVAPAPAPSAPARVPTQAAPAQPVATQTRCRTTNLHATGLHEIGPSSTRRCDARSRSPPASRSSSCSGGCWRASPCTKAEQEEKEEENYARYWSVRSVSRS